MPRKKKTKKIAIWIFLVLILIVSAIFFFRFQQSALNTNVIYRYDSPISAKCEGSKCSSTQSTDGSIALPVGSTQAQLSLYFNMISSTEFPTPQILKIYAYNQKTKTYDLIFDESSSRISKYFNIGDTYQAHVFTVLNQCIPGPGTTFCTHLEKLVGSEYIKDNKITIRTQAIANADGSVDAVFGASAVNAPKVTTTILPFVGNQPENVTFTSTTSVFGSTTTVIGGDTTTTVLGEATNTLQDILPSSSNLTGYVITGIMLIFIFIVIFIVIKRRRKRR